MPGRRQLEQLGFSARDVRHIVLTHLDFDHAGGLPEATVHVMQSEIATARDRGGFIASNRYRPREWDEVKHWQYYTFFIAGWEDIKHWRDRPECLLLKQAIVQRAEAATTRLHPAVVVGEQEVRDLLQNPEDFEELQRTIQMFTDILPNLIIQNASFSMGLANIRPVTTL